MVTGEPAAVHLRWGRSRCDGTARFSLRINEVGLRIVTGSRLCGPSRAGDPLTEVFGKGQKLTAIAVKFECVISEPPENDIVRLVVPRVITVESLS